MSLGRGIPGALVPDSTPGLCSDGRSLLLLSSLSGLRASLCYSLKGVAPVKTVCGYGRGVDMAMQVAILWSPRDEKQAPTKPSLCTIHQACPNSIPAPLALPTSTPYIKTPGVSKDRQFLAQKLPMEASVEISNPFLFLGYGDPMCPGLTS